MNRSPRRPATPILALALTFLGGWAGVWHSPESWSWNLPAGVPEPAVPQTNPMSAEKVTLGQHLFFDTRLSEDGSQSCSWCHRPQRAFTEGLTRSRGITGQVHPRNAPTLANVAWARSLNWADPEMVLLEEQALGPMFGTEPVELGMDGREEQLLGRLRADPWYRQAFADAFPGEVEPIGLAQVTQALAAYQRSLVSLSSPWDRYQAGDTEAMSPAALRGEVLFRSEALGCVNCHVPPFFTSLSTHEEMAPPDRFFNTGLYHLDEQGSYRPGNQGLHARTGDDRDRGRFRAPTLRNIQVTSPYMHDGSITTLNEVIDHYAAGGRVIEGSPLAGDGRTNPNKTPLVSGFSITDAERADLLAFLRSLTDRDFLRGPAARDPWPATRKPRRIP